MLRGVIRTDSLAGVTRASPQCLVCLRHPGEDQAGLEKIRERAKLVIRNGQVFCCPLLDATARPALGGRDKVHRKLMARTTEVRRNGTVGRCGAVRGRCGDMRGRVGL